MTRDPGVRLGTARGPRGGRAMSHRRTLDEWSVTWPVCTAHPECDHDVQHGSPGEADQFCADNRASMVNDRGLAICTCHPASEAVAFGVVAFQCGQGGPS